MSRRRWPSILQTQRSIRNDKFVKGDTTADATDLDSLQDVGTATLCLERQLKTCLLTEQKRLPSIKFFFQLQRVDLGNWLRWRSLSKDQQIGNLPCLPGLRDLTLACYDGSCRIEKNVPTAWLRELDRFSLVVHTDESLFLEEEQDVGERNLLGESVRHFALVFKHKMSGLTCAVTDFQCNRAGELVRPFTLAHIGSDDFCDLFKNPKSLETIEFGLSDESGRKLVLETMTSLVKHVGVERCSHDALDTDEEESEEEEEEVEEEREELTWVESESVLFQTVGLAEQCREWSAKLTGIKKVLLRNMPINDATGFAICVDRALFRGRPLEELTIEIHGAESDSLRSPRHSQNLVSLQMRLRRNGFRSVIVGDQLRQKMRSWYDASSGRAMRDESKEDSMLRERRERERRRCEREESLDYGTIDGECSATEAHKRILRRWAPRVYRRDRATLLSQLGEESSLGTVDFVNSYRIAWGAWARLARRVALNETSSVSVSKLQPLNSPIGVRVLRVNGKDTIVAVWDRDSTFNRSSAGAFAGGRLHSLEYLCGISLQVDPMNIVDVSRAPVMPTQKEVALHRQLVGNTEFERTLPTEISQWYGKTRAVMVHGLCTFGLRTQRPCLSVGVARSKGTDTRLYRTHQKLLRFAQADDTSTKTFLVE